MFSWEISASPLFWLVSHARAPIKDLFTGPGVSPLVMRPAWIQAHNGDSMKWQQGMVANESRVRAALGSLTRPKALSEQDEAVCTGSHVVGVEREPETGRALSYGSRA